MKSFNVASCTLSTLVFFLSAPVLANGNYNTNNWKFRPVTQAPSQFSSVRQNNGYGRVPPVYARNVRPMPQYYGQPYNIPYMNPRMQQPMRGRNIAYAPRLPIAPSFARQYGWPSRYNPMLPQNMNPRVVERLPMSSQRPVQRNYGGKLYQFRPAKQMRMARYPTPYQYSYAAPPAPAPVYQAYRQYQPYAYPMPMRANYPAYNMAYNPYMPMMNYYSQQSYMMPSRAYPVSRSVVANQYYRYPAMDERRINNTRRDELVFDISKASVKANRLSSVMNDDTHEIYRRYRWRPVN